MKKQEKRSRRRKVRGKGQAPGRVRLRRLPRVPPPDSEVWPEQYRGERWKPAYAILFAGKCQLCAYSCPLSKWRQGQDRCTGMPRLLLCTNRPDRPGEMVEVLPTETCRNFKAKSWRPRRAKAAQDRPAPAHEELDPTIRRITLSNGLLATVDAADYEELRKYRWHASRRGRQIYACCNTGGKTVYLHHMLLRPRRGCVVDHIDGNGLNNRRCNLRVCTPRQNHVNQRPRGGSSRFVGVYRRGNKWVAEIRCRGKRYHLGRFNDEIEAAKARDRKAYELHGEYAYLNFPEDYPPKKRS